MASLEDGSPEYLNVSFGYQRIGDSESESISDDSYSHDQSSDTPRRLLQYDMHGRLYAFDSSETLYPLAEKVFGF